MHPCTIHARTEHSMKHKHKAQAHRTFCVPPLVLQLNNGRLAMIAVAGMVAQELATGAKLF